MQWAQGISQRPYEAYTGPRISPFGSDQLAAFDMARDFGGVGASNYQGANALNQQAAGVMGGAGYDASTYDPSTFNTQTWNPAVAQQYMDPYLTQVMDSVLARNQQQFGQDQVARNSRAGRAGSFGGLRQGVEDAVAQGQFGLNQAMTEAQLLSQGYDRAFSGFSSDQQRLLEQQRLQEAANQFGAQFGDSSQRAEAELGMQRAQGLAGLGQQSADLGDQERDAHQQSMDALRSVGLDQQRQTQASLDLGYQDFINQRDYEMSMLNFYNSILRGMPVTPNSNVISYEQSNPYSQMLGMGLGAAGLVNALGGDAGAGGGGG